MFLLLTALAHRELNHLGEFLAGLQKEGIKRCMPRSIASVMKEAKEEGSFENLKTKGKKSKKYEGSPSQPCYSERLFAEQRVYPGEGGIHAVRL